jgi:hypothetical protein
MFGNSAWKTQEPEFLEVFLRKQIMFWLEKKQVPSWRKLRN